MRVGHERLKCRYSFFKVAERRLLHRLGNWEKKETKEKMLADSSEVGGQLQIADLIQLVELTYPKQNIFLQTVQKCICWKTVSTLLCLNRQWGYGISPRFPSPLVVTNCTAPVQTCYRTDTNSCWEIEENIEGMRWRGNGLTTVVRLAILTELARFHVGTVERSVVTLGAWFSSIQQYSIRGEKVSVPSLSLYYSDIQIPP